jgi:peptidoglycan hydrolase-like protein with peptidoglycan-binding domain
LTEQAVTCFQYLHDLTVDGIAGPITLAALAIPMPSLHPGTGFGRVGGSPAVRHLQRRLKALGFSPGPLDGLYGPLTTAAISRFQHSRSLRVDGLADAPTVRLMFKPAGRTAEPVIGGDDNRVVTPPEGNVRSVRPPTAITVPRNLAGNDYRQPTLPVGLLLAGLAALGLILTLVGYNETRREEAPRASVERARRNLSDVAARDGTTRALEHPGKER